MKILVVNSGSSSHKVCLYNVGDGLPEAAPTPLWTGKVEWSPGIASVIVKSWKGVGKTWKTETASRESLLIDLLTSSWSGETGAIASANEIDIVGHRVVHGGQRFRNPVLITGDVHSGIADLAEFAPLHIPLALEGMSIVERLLPHVPQFAVFDTAFHREMPQYAETYAGTYEWLQLGIRRYGFHGISHQYCATRAAQLVGNGETPLRIVSCHLGNGCSLAAIKGGRSLDTTMGFTPLDGVMMGTRSGSIDPGILLFLMRHHGFNSDQLEDVLNKRSGLLGISGLSGDMRTILSARRAGHERAKLAFDIYIHHLRTAIAGMAAVLNGLDVLVFTGGIGENCPEVRLRACEGLGFMGVSLNSRYNDEASPDADVTHPGSKARILIIRAEEEWAIAKDCWQLARSATPVA